MICINEVLWGGILFVFFVFVVRFLFLYVFVFVLFDGVFVVFDGSVSDWFISCCIGVKFIYLFEKLVMVVIFLVISYVIFYLVV